MPGDASLAHLPPPNVATNADRGDDAGAPPRRRRTLIAFAIIGPVVVGGVVAAMLLGNPSVVAAEGEHLPDLRDQPEIEWTHALADQFDLLFDDVLRGGDEWSWLADEIRSGDSAVLRDYRDVHTWDLEEGRAAFMPTVDGVSSRVHGMDTNSGEILWSTEPVTTNGRSCDVLDTSHLVCLTSQWDPVSETTRSTLHLFDGSDGSAVEEADLTRPQGFARLVSYDSGAALVLDGSDNRTTLTRYGTDGSAVWSADLPGADQVGTWHVDGSLVVQGTTYEADGWVEIVEVETGELRDGPSPAAPRADGWVNYREWAGQLIRTEHDSGSSRRTISLIDEGGERWWTTGEASLAGAARIESGAPVLLSDNDAGVLTALDPEDGAELWVHRQRGDFPWALLVTPSQIVIRDDEAVVVIDVDSGDVEWSRNLASESSVYAGARTLYELADGFRLRAVDIADGDELWTLTAPAGTGHASLRSLGGRLVLIDGDAIHGLR